MAEGLLVLTGLPEHREGPSPDRLPRWTTQPPRVRHRQVVSKAVRGEVGLKNSRVFRWPMSTVTPHRGHLLTLKGALCFHEASEQPARTQSYCTGCLPTHEDTQVPSITSRSPYYFSKARSIYSITDIYAAKALRICKLWYY